MDDQEIGTVNIPEGGMWEVGDFNSYLGPEVESPWEGEASDAPFDREFFLLMNVAVGGNGYFPDDAQNSPEEKPWSNTSSHAS